MRKLNLFIKRTFDIILSLIGIVMLTVIPVFIVIPIVIKLTSKGPVIYRQTRAGRNGKPFMMLKFRTMITEQYDKDGNEIMSEDRITKVGSFLRKTSLDETMQIFNILFGQMSLIGPRPMLLYQVERCTKEERRRLDMRPGLTGWAQIQGRNNISWPVRIQYDLEYIRKFNILMDINILYKTVLLVLKGAGTDVKPQYREIDRFSKHYVPEKQNPQSTNEQ